MPVHPVLAVDDLVDPSAEQVVIDAVVTVVPAGREARAMASAPGR